MHTDWSKGGIIYMGQAHEMGTSRGGGAKLTKVFLGHIL